MNVSNGRMDILLKNVSILGNATRTQKKKEKKKKKQKPKKKKRKKSEGGKGKKHELGKRNRKGRKDGCNFPSDKAPWSQSIIHKEGLNWGEKGGGGVGKGAEKEKEGGGAALAGKRTFLGLSGGGVPATT